MLVTRPYLNQVSAPPSAGTDPFWANVVFLESFDASGDSPFVDKKSGVTFAKTAELYTPNGVFDGAMVTTSTSAFYSVFNSTIPVFGTGDFTIEARLKYENIASMGSNYYIALSGVTWALRVYNNRFTSTGNLGAGTALYTIPENTWFNFALSRINGVSTMYVDGIAIHSQANTSSVSGNRIELNRPFTVGGCIAYMDECRWTNGVGRYPTNYTPSTTPFPSS
jgi:hypothetical protein